MIKVNPEKAKTAIMDLIEEIPSLMNVEETSNKYREWCSYLESTLITIYGDWKEEPTVKAIYRILHPVFSPSSPYPIDPKVMYQDKLNNIKAKLEGLYNSLLMFSGTDNNEESNNIDKEVDFLANILKNFHRCALQLRDRQNNQAAFIIKNEYDVQDLLHANLLPNCKVLNINTPKKQKVPKETNWKQKFQKPQNENICLTYLNTEMNGNFHFLSFCAAFLKVQNQVL